MALASPGPITLCGSLSLHPVTLGASMHEAAYAALGVPFRYVPFAMDGARLAAALDAMRTLAIRGYGISMPFKIDVIPLLDETSALAAEIGAVNTVVNEGDRLVGHNTDALGAVSALEEIRPVAGRRCLVIGAGGAARAVVHGLAKAGARVTVVNRTDATSAALAAHARVDVVPFVAMRDALGSSEIVVNASSAGMNAPPEAPSPFDVAGIAADALVMDIVYKPTESSFVRAARARGLQAIDGSRMLLHQAGKQVELYTGLPAPLEAMNQALTKALAT